MLRVEASSRYRVAAVELVEEVFLSFKTNLELQTVELSS